MGTPDVDWVHRTSAEHIDALVMRNKGRLQYLFAVRFVFQTVTSN